MNEPLGRLDYLHGMDGMGSRTMGHRAHSRGGGSHPL